MSREHDPRAVSDGAALLGEGPVWIPAEGAVYWVDIKAPAVHRHDPATGENRSWPMPEEIGCIAPRARGGFVAALRSGFAWIDLDGVEIERFAAPEPDVPGNRFNDGKCDAAGRLWAGTMDDGETRPTGALYRLDPDGAWHRMDEGYVVTNGPAFRPDGRVLYHTDTFERVVYAFDLSADGSLSNKRPFVRIPEGEGYPDGMTCDAEGFLWVAHWGGWRLTRFTPEGEPERVIELPVAQVTSCCFGGPELDRLYVTTASIGLDDAARDAQPLAGHLFEVPAPVRGLPPQPFLG